MIIPLSIVGKNVKMVVDGERRTSLSKPHSASHFMALALNKVLSVYWKKEIGMDGLGNPNFDQLAISVSSIEIGVSVDKYRIGKSLKKKGFDTQLFEKNIDKIELQVNSEIQQWLNSGNTIHVETEGKYVTSMRWWITNIEGKEVKIPCGGTHVKSVSDIEGMNVTMVYNAEESSLVIRSAVN